MSIFVSFLHSLGLHYGLPWKPYDFNIMTLYFKTIYMYVLFLYSGGPFKQFGLQQKISRGAR